MKAFNMKLQSAPSMVVVFLALGAILAGGFALVGTGQRHVVPATEAGSQNQQPITECFESRVTYTSVNRVENVVQKYGYPNVKCSKSTSGVLWFGDPFDGTIPMGDMPVFKDGTGGDFANAVVSAREPHLTYFNLGPNGCEFCHNGKTVPFPKDKQPRLLAMHQDVVEDSLQLKHGRGAVWCLDCHDAPKRNKLVDRQGNVISFNQPQKLCGSCHGEVYIDWRTGIHGKRIGSWAVGGKKRWWVCTECHNPHTVQINRFDPIKPELPPPLPRGMASMAYERESVGSSAHANNPPDNKAPKR